MEDPICNSNQLLFILIQKRQLNDFLESNDKDRESLSKKLSHTSKADGKSIVDKHMDIHKPLSKMGKHIDKHFEPTGPNISGVPGERLEILTRRLNLRQKIASYLKCHKTQNTLSAFWKCNLRFDWQ